ncbi:MAG: dipeptidase PepE, partial [Candidatus Kapaibacterium sp.]
NNLIFISYARPGGVSLENYSAVAKGGFKNAGLDIKGIEEFDNPIDAINNCDGIFTGGGNTFLLLKTLYEKGLIDPIKERVDSGLPYMGTSAGSNIAGPSVKTTNDMPIVYPPSFDAFDFVPFNINPHYLDPDPHSTHKGETRETRINEYHHQNDNIVVGLREGSILKIENNDITLIGKPTLRIFEKGKEPKEYDNSANINFLLD